MWEQAVHFPGKTEEMHNSSVVTNSGRLSVPQLNVAELYDKLIMNEMG
jgi:hypothetical protein